MDYKVVPVKEGKLSPEYKTFLKNSGDLASLLSLPVNKSDASIKLVEAELISPDENVAGREILISSVLKSVEFDAMNFYKLLAVLQHLSKTEKIFPQLHQEFYGRHMNRLSSWQMFKL